jgi:CRP-like cAMP-binding protein
MAVKSMPLAHFEGDALSVEELAALEIFKDVKPDMIAKFPGTVRRRTFDRGDVICRQGEGGTTAFYILEGQARIFITRREESKHKRRQGGLIAAVGRVFGQRPVPGPRSYPAQTIVPIDASVDLRYGSLIATLGKGDIFGEMSCLQLAPRSATVIAESPCVMIEILRNMYDLLLRSKTFKEQMDQVYRQRALDNHLRNVWLFQDMPPDVLGLIRERVELLTLDAGAVVFNEGEAPDSMYLIRRGQVSVSKQFPGGPRRLAYLTKGDCFGEMGLLADEPRSATCVAADHPLLLEGGRKRRPAQVELVRIGKDLFEEVTARHPAVRDSLRALAAKRQTQQERARHYITPTVFSKEVEELGLVQGQNLMLIDLEKCTRCDQCAQACTHAHEDGLSRLIREGPRIDKYLVPASCRMCLDPVCMIGCPVGSIRKAKDLNILIEDWCVGCGVCAKQCPYNSIQMHGLEEFGKDVSEGARRVAEGGEVVEVSERAVVCDQCSSLPTGPACVYACPHDAAMRVNAAEFLTAGASGAAASNSQSRPSFIVPPQRTSGSHSSNPSHPSQPPPTHP